MQIADRIYGACARLLTAAAGAATLLMAWLLWSLTYAPERLYSPDAHDALSFMARTAAFLIPPALIVMAAARAASLAQDAFSS